MYYKNMKKMTKTLFTTLILVLALTLVLGFDSQIAKADELSSVPVFDFDYVGGEFILTEQATGDVVYQKNYYSVEEVLEAIESVVGVDGDFDIELPIPTLLVLQDKGNQVETYSQTENKFQFTATTYHVFDGLMMEGYEGVDENDYTWYFSRDNGAETQFGGHGSTVDFGKNNAYGKYYIFAEATVSLTIDGKTFTATGKGFANEIEIKKSNEIPDIGEDALTTSGHVYGRTIGEIIDTINTPSRLYSKFELTEGYDQNQVLDAGTHGVLVYYVSGVWEQGEFIPNESMEKVLVSLNVTISPRDVRILVYNTSVIEGTSIDINNYWEYIGAYRPQSGVTLADMGVTFWLETEDGQKSNGTVAGKYVIKAESTNPNYDVLFLTPEFANASDYSRWAVLTVKEAKLTASDNDFVYTLTRNDGFEFGDKIVLQDREDGGKTIKIYNGTTSVEYDDLRLTIERKDEKVVLMSIFKDGQWQNVRFDENGKYTINYSTANANSFGVRAIVTTPDEGPDVGVIVGAVVGSLVAVAVIVLIVIFMKKKKNGGDDNTAQEDNEEDGDVEKDSQETIEENVAEKSAEDTEEKQLTLEEKYALHPDFVPTPSVEDAFKGVETEDNIDDEKDVEDSAEDSKITFKSKILSASVENRAIYNALKNNILSYKGVKSRVVNGGDYFRRPGKQIVKIIFIGKTIRLALALNPEDYDYNLYHQKNRGNMKKYSDTPMFVKVQSLLGVRRALKLISDLMAQEGLKPNKKWEYDDYIYNLVYHEE